MSVDEKTLLKLRQGGVESLILDLRLEHAEVLSLLKYLRPLVDRDRVYPSMLPTQKSGRWSTKNPPLVNWSQECINPECSIGGVHITRSDQCWSLRDIVGPDPGSYWILFDWDAIEAKLAAAYSDDEEDLRAFTDGLDIHTLTACRLWRLPLPPDLKNPHKAPSCAEWREKVMPGGKDAKPRVGAKTARYSLAYGTDKMSILQAKDVEKQGLTRDELLDTAERYLKSKPKLVAFKKRTWEDVLRKREARTSLGRRRRLFPTEGELVQFLKTKRATATAREGLNHMFQGEVASRMNRTLIAITRRWSECRLAYQSHDGAKLVFPESVECWPEIRDIVESVWEINGHRVKATATWGRIWADGRKEPL